MGFITIFHHHLGNMFVIFVPTTKQANLSFFEVPQIYHVTIGLGKYYPETLKPNTHKWLAINWMMNQIFTLEMVGNNNFHPLKKMVMWSSGTMSNWHILGIILIPSAFIGFPGHILGICRTFPKRSFEFISWDLTFMWAPLKGENF